MEQGANKAQFVEERKRSIAKAVSYRILVLALDFTVLYLWTRRLDIAAGFTIVSNIYTSAAYYAHERFWDRIRWGRRRVGGPLDT